MITRSIEVQLAEDLHVPLRSVACERVIASRARGSVTGAERRSQGGAPTVSGSRRRGGGGATRQTLFMAFSTAFSSPARAG